MNAYASLAARIRQALIDLERVVGRAQSLVAKAQSTADDGYYDGAALNIHGFYAGIERIFEDIAAVTGEGLPSGSAWHQDLLLQMSAEIEDVRPPVIAQTTRYCLDEYRGFRHVVRNVYTFNLRPSRIAALGSDLGDCYAAVSRDLLAFADYLSRLARELHEISEGDDH